MIPKLLFTSATFFFCLGAPTSPLLNKDSSPFIPGLPLTDEEFNSEPAFPEFPGDVNEHQLYHYDIIHGNSKNAINKKSSLWPNGIVPYVISADYSAYYPAAVSASQRNVIAQAMNDYHLYTCIRFVPRTAEVNYLIIKKTGTGCNCHVGMIGGEQTVSLDDGCVGSKSTPIHEFMHAVGFWHEQTRYDRDDYVTIYWDNIIPEYAFAFDAYGPEVTRLLGTTYDFDSVMQYGAYSFAIDYMKPTITRKSGSTQLGNNYGFSQNDILKINRLYGCNKNDTCWDEEARVCPSLLSCSQFYCDAHAEVMMAKCKQSCGFCDLADLTPQPDPDCLDYNDNCDYWASVGECVKNPGYMHYYCRKACKLCTPSRCRDLYADCNGWAQNGECTSNPSFMNTFCKKACNACVLH